MTLAARHIRAISIQDVSRFLSGVKRGAPSDCWPWMRGLSSRGYGVFNVRRIQHSTHRVAFLLANDTIRDDLLVMHACDNRRCCNPSHLSQGTHSENNKQAYAHGNNPRRAGSKHPLSKLTERQVEEIRLAVASGELHRVVASRYGVHRRTVTGIVEGRRWGHVALTRQKGDAT